MNNELITSAVSFLKDPNVSSAPFAKKVEFLESKGLNQQEIEEAIKRANGDSSSTTSTSSGSTVSSNNNSGNMTYASPPVPAPVDYYNYAPPVPERSWKDYFIMATATAGVTYGLYQVVSRYLIPNIIPPSKSSVEKDKEKIDEEFLKIDKLLEQLAEDQAEIKSANETKCKEIDVAINNVNDFMSKFNKDKLTFDDDLRLMKLEVDNLRNSIEKNMNATKENIKSELEEIGEELQSLKNLIQARAERGASSNEGGRKLAPVSSIPSASQILKKAQAAKSESSSNVVGTSNTANSPKNNNVVAAGIPEWQLKHKKEEEAKNSATTSNTTKTLESNDISSSSDNIKDIPSWQQSGEAAEASQDLQKAFPSWQQVQSQNEEKVEAAIASNGVPSWQLNSSG